MVPFGAAENGESGKPVAAAAGLTRGAFAGSPGFFSPFSKPGGQELPGGKKGVGKSDSRSAFPFYGEFSEFRFFAVPCPRGKTKLRPFNAIPKTRLVLKQPFLHKPLKIIRKVPAPLIAALIWFLSSQRILPKPKGILGFDKLQHLLAFAVLACAAGLWVSREKWKSRARFFLLIIAAIGSAYGIVDEVHQFFVPGRDCNVWDWIADTLGAVIGAAAVAGVMAVTDRHLSKEGEAV
jgi:VanZ family protein